MSLENLAFEDFRYLYLLGLVPVFLLLSFKNKTGNFISKTLRVLSIALICLALSGPSQTIVSTEQEVSALLDTSKSIREDAKESYHELLEPYLDESDINAYAFAGEVSKTSFSPNSSSKINRELSEELNPGNTNIAQAIDSVLTAGSTSSILLLSDGFENKGQAAEIATKAKQLGVAIYPLIGDQELYTQSSLQISSLHAPLTVNAGDIVETRVSVKNTFKEDKKTRLEVWIDNKKLYANILNIPAGEEKLITVNTPEDSLKNSGGLKRLRAVIYPDDGSKETLDESHRWVSIKEKSRLLLLSGKKEDRRVIARALGVKGYAVDDFIADGRTPFPKDFKGISVVIMNNISKKQLPANFLDKLKGFVEDGGGLLLIGGDRSFGLGKYVDTKLEEISPIEFVPPKKAKKRVNSAVVLVLDKSRSMVNQDKIHAAKRAALTAIEALKDDDHVGVIGFDKTPFVIIRLEKVKKVKTGAERRLRNLTAAGKTNLLPALKEAERALNKANTGRKHIIVLSDGKIPGAGSRYTGLVGRLRAKGISVSTVALGGEADVPFMKSMAKQGKGAFYHTLDPSKLPEIFLHDIKVTTGEQTLKERKKFTVAEGPSGIRSTRFKDFPHLKGFVETKAKDRAKLELVTKQKNKTFPIFASWDYKFGKVSAFTSDANGRWSDPWVKWKGFANFWGHIIESLQPRMSKNSDNLDFDLRSRIEGDNILLDLSVFDPGLANKSPPSITLKITEPGGEISNKVFNPSVPGRFSAKVKNARAGDYKLDIRYGRTKLPPLAITASPSAFGEAPGKGINVQTLSEIAYLSGGAINPDPAVLESNVRTTKKSRSLALPLIIAAFILILLEAFCREVLFNKD